MQGADEPIDDSRADRSSRSFISVAILAALAFMPIVVAAGFLTDRRLPAVSVPGDISVLALRGMIDGAAASRPAPPARAGY